MVRLSYRLHKHRVQWNRSILECASVTSDSPGPRPRPYCAKASTMKSHSRYVGRSCPHITNQKASVLHSLSFLGSGSTLICGARSNHMSVGARPRPRPRLVCPTLGVEKTLSGSVTELIYKGPTQNLAQLALFLAYMTCVCV